MANQEKKTNNSKSNNKVNNKKNNKTVKKKTVKGTTKKESTKAVKEEKVISALDAYGMITKSLDEEINDDGKTITLLDVTPTEQKISNEQMMDLKEAFECLSEQEKELLINRYFKDLTQSEVAELFGVNQVYVSRLEKKALTKMKNKMS